MFPKGQPLSEGITFSLINMRLIVLRRKDIWEKIVAEAMSSSMRKHYGCEHVAEGEVRGSKISPDFPVSFEMSWIREKGSLNKEILHVVIKHYITQLS